MRQLKLTERKGYRLIETKFRNKVIEFVPDWDQFERNLVFLFEQQKDTKYEMFDVGGRLNPTEDFFAVSIPDVVDPKALSALIPGLEVIAIFVQHSIQSVTSGRDVLIILFKFDRSIKYCITDWHLINKDVSPSLCYPQKCEPFPLLLNDI